MRVLNFGSINIDHVYHVDHIVRLGETLNSYKKDTFIGGKGLNQSIAIARSGVKVFHAGKIGYDGEFILDIMKDSGVDTRFVGIDFNNFTGNAIIQKDICGNNSIILNNSVNHQISIENIEIVLEQFKEGDLIILQNEINNIPYLINRSYEKDLKIVFNPAPITKDIKEYPLEKVDYLIINEIEAMGILNKSNLSEDELVYELSNKFKTTKIVLTLGEKGAIFIGDNIIYTKAFSVNTVDTTAAGDTFIGYLVKGIINDYPIKNMLKLASGAAALSVTKLGAEPSIPKIEEVNKFIEEKGEENEIL